jgi:hypothetical protein
MTETGTEGALPSGEGQVSPRRDYLRGGTGISEKGRYLREGYLRGGTGISEKGQVSSGRDRYLREGTGISEKGLSPRRDRYLREGTGEFRRSPRRDYLREYLREGTISGKGQVSSGARLFCHGGTGSF